MRREYSALVSKRQVQLLVLAVIVLAGLVASGIWLWTAQKSWKAVMLEQSVNRD